MGIVNPRSMIGRTTAPLPDPPATVEVLADTGGALRIQLLAVKGSE